MSEILQSISLSLPQFLLQLKLHNYNLKDFTTKLESRPLTELELKRVEGNVAEMLKLLDDGKSVELPSVESTTLESLFYTRTTPQFKKISKELSKKPPTTTSATITTTQRKMASTAKAKENIIEQSTHAAIENSKSSELSTTTTSPQVAAKQPKTFGFRPSSNTEQLDSGANTVNISMVEETKKLPEEANVTENNIDNDTIEKSTPMVYKPKDEELLDRMTYNNRRGVVRSRLGGGVKQSTVRPPYSYYGGDTDTFDFTFLRNKTSNETFGNNAIEEKSTESIRRNTIVVGLTEHTPFGDQRFDHPRFDKDPNSLSIATRSAIMAAGVLGGIALAVFLTILIFVMYTNHTGKRRIAIPFPLSLSSDESTSSTPPLYSTKIRSGIGTKSSHHSDFWGTLKRKFDPYSLSSTSASYY